MEEYAESLRNHYEQMETEDLIALYRRGSLTEVAFGVLDDVLNNRGIARASRPRLDDQVRFCSPKLVEDGLKMGLIMSNARLHEVLANWRSRRPEAIAALLLAACGYAGLAAVGVMFIGYIDSNLVQIVVALFIAASGFAAVMRLFGVVEEAIGNERVRHMKAVYKAGGYPPAEVAAEDARNADAAKEVDACRAAEAARSRARSHPTIQPFESVRVIKNISTPKDPDVYDGDVTSAAFLQSYEWRKLRMQALILHGARCQCCGASMADGAVIHVDHIKPRKYFPELALDIENLQVLCHECNHGKGNWDWTPWKDRKSCSKASE